MTVVGMCYAVQGPATLNLAEQVGIVKKPKAGEDQPNVKDLPRIGLANALDAGAGVFGGLLGGYLVDVVPFSWHYILCSYIVVQGIAMIGTFLLLLMVAAFIPPLSR